MIQNKSQTANRREEDIETDVGLAPDDDDLSRIIKLTRWDLWCSLNTFRVSLLGNSLALTDTHTKICKYHRNESELTIEHHGRGFSDLGYIASLLLQLSNGGLLGSLAFVNKTCRNLDGDLIDRYTVLSHAQTSANCDTFSNGTDTRPEGEKKGGMYPHLRGVGEQTGSSGPCRARGDLGSPLEAKSPNMSGEKT